MTIDTLHLLALIGALWLICLSGLLLLAVVIAFRTRDARRPYHDEHQGA